jgi:hypothetical protein
MMLKASLSLGRAQLLYEGKWERVGVGLVKWHRAVRRVPFGARKNLYFQGGSVLRIRIRNDFGRPDPYFSPEFSLM